MNRGVVLLRRQMFLGALSRMLVSRTMILFRFRMYPLNSEFITGIPSDFGISQSERVRKWRMCMINGDGQAGYDGKSVFCVDICDDRIVKEARRSNTRLVLDGSSLNNCVTATTCLS